MKIYVEDSLVPYKTTKIPALTTKAEIDGLLARWGIREVYWNWNPENDNVFVLFKIPETFGDIQPSAKLEPPRIWNKETRNRKEEINWPVSMRVLYWFTKSYLEIAYLMNFDRTTVFLPFIVTRDGHTRLKDIIMPRLGRVSEFEALPTEDQVHQDERRQLDKTKILTIPKENQT